METDEFGNVAAVADEASPGAFRKELIVPITLTINGQSIVGLTQSFSGTGVSVHSMYGSATAGELCDVVFHLTAGNVQATGVIARVDPDPSHLQVELTRFTLNGPELLRCLMSPGG